MTEKEKQEIIELVHKTLHDFCEPFPEGELGARPLTQTEKCFLKNKNIIPVNVQYGSANVIVEKLPLWLENVLKVALQDLVVV